MTPQNSTVDMGASIIIPVLNQDRHTQQCIESIYRNSTEKFEIIVVDNGSTDQTQAICQEYLTNKSNFQVLRFEKNQGYSIANNRGAELAKYNNFIFLNNDTIVTQGWLEPLLNELNKPGIGVSGPKLCYPDTNNINHAGYVYSGKIHNYYPIYHGFPGNAPCVNQPRHYQALLGACFAVSKTDFLAISGFSDYGLEDIDFCLKLNELGKKSSYVPHSRVMHYGSLTLKNSAHLIPTATTDLFNQRWPSDSILADDLNYYLQDDYEIEIFASGAITIRHKVNKSFELIDAANKAIDKSDMPAAFNLFAEAVKCDPGNKNPVIQLATAALNTGQLELGAEYLEAALKIDPLHFEIHLALFRLYLQALNDKNKAELHKQLLLNTADVPFELKESLTAE